MFMLAYYDPGVLNIILGIVTLLVLGFVHIGTSPNAKPAEWRSQQRTFLWVEVIVGLFWIVVFIAESSSWSDAIMIILLLFPLASVPYIRHQSIKDAKFCPQCGFHLNEDGTPPKRFCPECGAALPTPKPPPGGDLLE